MADDLYSALIGEGVGNNGELIANALRRRRQMGELGLLTGDKVLGATGKDLTSSSDDYAEMLQNIRQKDIDNAQTKAYQTGQLEHMDRVLKETMRNNDLDFLAAMLAAQAREAAAAGKTPKIPKLRASDIKDLRDNSETIGIIDGVKDFLDNGGSFGAVTVSGVPIPGMRSFKNYAASKGMGSPEDMATFNAKQNWDRLYNIASRNKMFGATLTKEEKKSWDEANPSTGMTDAQIKAALPIMRKVFKHRIDKLAGGLIKEGYNAEAIADYADVPGINLPTRVGGGEAGAESAPAPAAGGAKRFKRVDGKWVPVE